MKINIKKLTTTAKIPTRGSEYAAGYDLYADITEEVVIEPHETAKIGTGLSIEIPDGYFGAVFARSGPITKMDARIFLTSSWGTSDMLPLPGCTTIVWFCQSSVTVAPSDLRISHMTSTSRRWGTSLISHTPSDRIVAAIMGKTAFLLPEMVTSPRSGPLCSTIYLAKVINLRNFPLLLYLQTPVKTTLAKDAQKLHNYR